MKTGLWGGVLVAVGSVGLALRPTRTASTTPKLKVLDAAEYAVLAALAERTCPALGEGAPGATALKVAEQVDELLSVSDQELQKGTKIALRILDNALSGALAGEHLTVFTALDAEAQDRVLAEWRGSRVGFRRTVYKGLTAAIFALYWGDERTWPRIGYDGPPDMERLREVYAEELVELDALRATPLAKGA